MNVWRKLKGVFGLSDEPHSLDSVMKQAGYDPDSLIYSAGQISRDKAATMSALHRAVSLIAGSAADAIVDSVHVVDRTTGRKVSSPKSEYVVSLLRDSPDGMCCAHTFLEDAMTDLLVSGNALFLKMPSSVNTNRIRLILCNPINATVNAGPDGKDMFRVLPDSARDGNYREFDIPSIIVARWPRINGRTIGGSSHRDRYLSRPPITTLKNAILLALGAEAWASAIFDKRCSSLGNDYAILVDEMMTPEQQEKLFEYLVEFGKGRAPLVLGGTSKIEKLGVSPADADLQSLRKFQIGEVARMYGVPSVLIGQEDAGNVWGSSVAELTLAFRRYGLRHHVNRILEPMSFHLLPRNERLVVDESRSFRGDAESLSKIIRAARPDKNSSGVLSRHEMRALFGVNESYDDDWGTKGGN